MELPDHKSSVEPSLLCSQSEASLSLDAILTIYYGSYSGSVWIFDFINGLDTRLEPKFNVDELS